MIILSLDCSGAWCSVCLWSSDGRGVLALGHDAMDRGQDARLVPLIQDVMAGGGLEFKELDRVAVSKGPGSFTGLRVALATAQGIGFAASKPVVGIDRFSIHRAQQKTEKNQALLVALDSRRQELFTRYYPAHSKPPHEPALMTRQEIEERYGAHETLVVAGDARALLKGIFEDDVVCAPVGSESVTCAMLACDADPSNPLYAPRPLYLRPPDVTIKACEATE